MGSVNRTPGRGERHNVCVWQKWHGYWQYYLLVLSWTSLNGTVLWGPFLERPEIFSGLKVNFKIKTCWIVAQFLAHKPVKNYWNFVRKCKHGKHKTAFRGPNSLIVIRLLRVVFSSRFLPLTEGVITTRSNRMKFRLGPETLPGLSRNRPQVFTKRSVKRKVMFGGIFFFKYNYCHASHTRFAVFFLLPSYCVSSLKKYSELNIPLALFQNKVMIVVCFLCYCTWCL